MRRIECLSAVLLFVICSSGCSTMGLTLWPSQFPLLKQTKEFASQSPLPSGLPHELAKNVILDYYVEPGDRLLIEPVALDSSFRTIGDQEVLVDGSIDLREYGRLRVGGMTVESIEQAIEDRIEEISDEAEDINVQLVETNASKIYVLGQVGSPGSYPLDGNELVLDGILAAGGLTSEASPCDIILVRPTAPNRCRVVLPVCYRQITQLGDVTTNYQLQPGDRIVVGSRTLCEELAIWKQTNSCSRCCRSCCVEKRPAGVNYGNRFLAAFSQFPLPAAKQGNNDAAEQSSARSDLVPPPAEELGPIEPAEDIDIDSDVFLDPAEVD